MSRTSQSLSLSSPFVGSLIGFMVVACSVDTQGTGKNTAAGGKTGGSSQIGGAQARGGGSSTGGASAMGGVSTMGGSASSESSSSSGGSDANGGGTSSESSSSSGGSGVNSGGSSGEQGGNSGANGGTSNTNSTLAGGDSSGGTIATTGGSSGAGGAATGGFAGTAGSTLIASGGTVGEGGSTSLTTGTQALPICNETIADLEFSFSHVSPAAISKKVAICKIRGDLTEDQKSAFSDHAACATPAAVLNIAGYSAAEKHAFVTELAQNLHDLTSYKSSADGYYLVELLGTFYSWETYQSGACDCNSSAYEYADIGTAPRLVSLYFYQHPGCSNTGTNSILGNVYGVAHTQVIWPGYSYDDVGVMGALPYLSNDCSTCAGTAQPLPNEYTEAYGRTTACGGGTYSALPQRVVCALNE